MHEAASQFKARTAALIGLILTCAVVITIYELGAFSRFLSIALFRDLFQSIVWEGLPFVVLGVALSAAVEVWVRSDVLAGALSDGLFGRLMAGLSGLFVPACDCGVVPLARGLRRKGVSESVAFTFALSVPTVNWIAMAATFFAFHRQWQWLFLRMGAALSIALVAGFVVRFGEEGLTERVRPPEHVHAGALGRAKWRSVVAHAQGELFSVGPFFAASALLAGIVQGFAPLRAVTVFTHDSLWSIPLMMVLGALISLCSSADAFVAVGLSTLFSPGAILAFLLAGQMIDVRNLVMMPQVFSRRTLIVGLAVAAVGIFAAALLANHLTFARALV